MRDPLPSKSKSKPKQEPETKPKAPGPRQPPAPRRATAATADFAAFAATAPGLEQLAAFELRRLGLTAARAEPGGASFRATPEGVQRANLWLRTAERVLLRISHFRADSFALLEQKARQVDWARWLRPGARVALSVTCHKSRLYHSAAVAERVAGAIDGQVAGIEWLRLGELAPDHDPDLDGDGDGGGEGGVQGVRAGGAAAMAQRVFVRLDHDACALSLDSSGERLHRRGYRRAIGEAPLRETLAAAVALSGGLQPRVPGLGRKGDDAAAAGHWLLDPMCGAGTIPIEALRLLCNVAPGRERAFAFQSWPSHEAARWQELRARARAAELAPPGDFRIEGRDIDGRAIAAARLNAAQAGIPEGLIEWRVAELEALPRAATAGLVISNPPYGRRLGEARALRAFYRRVGAILRERRPGSRLSLLLPEAGGFDALHGLPLEARFTSKNGGIPVALFTGELSGGGRASSR